jgi:transcription factor SFP1
VVNSPSSASQMDLSLEMDADSKWAYGGDELDVDMEELDQESPESEVSTATNSTQTSPLPGHATPGLIASKIATGQAITSALNNLALNEMKPGSSSSGSRSKSSDDISAFDSYVVSSPPKAVEPDLSMKSKVKPTNLAASRRALHGGINGRPAAETPTKNAFGLNVRRQSPEPAKTTTGFTAVAPNVLFTNANAPTPIASPAVAEVTPTTFGAPPPAESTPSPVSSNATPAGWKVSAPSASQADITPQPSLFSTHRPFRCPQPGCQKSYKQANGLK